jgi:hypothetical protein
MMLEWLRRRDPKLNEHLRTYLFTQGSILEIEEAAEGQGKDQGKDKSGGGDSAGDGSLGIGSLRP